MTRRRRGAYRPLIGGLLFLFAAVAPLSLLADGIKLDSREYKLMLKPGSFPGADPEAAIKRFTTQHLIPAVRAQWTADAADELLEKGLKPAEKRTVTFKDTNRCELYHNGFAWRERADIKADGTRSSKAEVTLKFRSPDAFLASKMLLEAGPRAEGAKSKLEEDLSPLAVRTGSDKGAIANPHSARSQFSRSTTQETDRSPADLAAIAALYPTFEREWSKLTANIPMTTPLASKSDIFERVYESSKLKIAKDFKGEFALTLWYEQQNSAGPFLAEISYKYSARDDVPFEAARAALGLLIKLQDSDWADPSAPTKTSYVACASSH